MVTLDRNWSTLRPSSQAPDEESSVERVSISLILGWRVGSSAMTFCDSELRSSGFRQRLPRCPWGLEILPVLSWAMRHLWWVAPGAWLEADCLAAESLEVEMQP